MRVFFLIWTTALLPLIAYASDQLMPPISDQLQLIPEPPVLSIQDLASDPHTLLLNMEQRGCLKGPLTIYAHDGQVLLKLDAGVSLPPMCEWTK